MASNKTGNKTEREVKVIAVGKTTDGFETPVYVVTSGSEDGKTHLVRRYENLGSMRCDCEGYRWRGACSHTSAVTSYLLAKVNHDLELSQARNEGRQEEQERQRQADRARDTSMLRRDNRSFAERFLR